MPNGFGLTGKICAVTGGGSGIGCSVALALGREGARVAVIDRDSSAAHETAAQLRAQGAEAVAVETDTSDVADVGRAAATINAAFGEVEVLVNSAGILGQGASLLDLAIEDWDRMLAVNLTGYFICAQVFGRPMVARRSGAMVHVASISAVQTLPGAGNYGVTKAGVAMLSRLLAAELGPFGVRSNVVSPGFVESNMTRASYADPQVTAGRAGMVALGRIGQPRDIAEAVLFLASPAAAYVTGAELLVDGGLAQNLFAKVPRAS